MISNGHTEPGNSATAELSWKTVKKGFRSTTRRPRKMNRCFSNYKGSEEDTSVTESEELGVAVLGNRFSEKVDHLPIKKRRPVKKPLLLPPHIPFNESCEVSGRVAGALDGFENSAVNKRLPCSGDSYGIELLAAAACATSINDEVSCIKSIEVVEKVKALPQIDAINPTSLDATIVSSQKEISLKDIRSEADNGSRDQNNSVAGSGYIHGKCDTEAGKGTSSGKDIRFPWDLNKAAVDECELPNESMDIDSPTIGSHVGGKGLHSAETVKFKDEQAWGLLKCPSNIQAFAHLIEKTNWVTSGSDVIPSQAPLKEKLNLSASKTAEKVDKNHCLSPNLQLYQTLTLENVQVRKENVATTDPTISEKSMCDVVRIKLNEEKVSELPIGRNTIMLMGATLDAEDSSSKSGKAETFVENGVDFVGDLNVPLKGGPLVGSTEVKVKKKEVKSGERSGETAVEDLLDDGDVSDYSPGGHHHLVRIERMSKYQSGYESPVEDGELRESVSHSWQENVDEIDCVDYNMGDREANGKLPVKVTSGKNDFLMEKNNVKSGELGVFDFTQKFDMRRSSGEKVDSRVTRKSTTHLQGSSVLGSFDWKKDSRDVQRRSGACFHDREVYHGDKYYGRDRTVPRLHDGSQKNNQDDVSGNWGSRNHYQNGYRRGGGNPRPRYNNLPDANRDELAYDDDQRRSRSNYPKGEYRPIVRRPHDDNHNYVNKGNLRERDDHNFRGRGRGRGRGRAGFYRREFVNGNKDEDHDSIADDSAPWVPHNHSARRQYSPSPGYHRNRSRSRSRTRSPVPWHLRRERNAGGRRMSRSPDFRSDDRLGRNRNHYNDDSKFSENDGYGSPPRKRFYNDRNNGPTRFRETNSPGRYFGQRQRFGSNGTGGRMKGDDGGFRPRFNPERFSEKSGGGWRGRNNNTFDGSDGERLGHNSKYGDSDRMKYSSKNEMVNRVRHSETDGTPRRFRSEETDGTPRRFRSEADDCFEDHCTHDKYNNNNSNDSCVRSTEKSDELGEKGQCKNDGDGMCTIGLKLPKVGDNEDDVAVAGG